jgi:signal transduction histidine kinase/CheY-like chemotaxis protein
VQIRTRLLLLVLAVWLPAAAGFALLARSTYERETDAARERLQQLGMAMGQLAERELDQRATLARALAASQAVRELELRRFHAEAAAAVDGTGAWAVLFDDTHQLANTRMPPDATAPWPSSGRMPLASDAPVTLYVAHGAVVDRPLLAVMVPAPHAKPPRHNVAVCFEVAVMQAIVAAQALPEGSVASIVDQDQRVMARSRNPSKWIGELATGDVKRRAEAGDSGFAESVTLDGVPSFTYLSPSNRYGWTVIIAMPRSAFAAAARRVTVQAAAAAGVLLVVGLGLALFGARRIAQPMRALREAAAVVGRDAVPPRLVTGVPEADEVSRALHEAALRSHEATRTLEQRVAEAVRQSQEAQAKLLDAQKHEAIGRLTGGIAHDFNNLLQTISTAHQVLDRHVAEGPQRRILQGAMRATAKAADLIRQMLAFGRAQPLQPQPVSLADLLLTSRELTGRAVGKRVRLTAAIEPDVPPVFVDPIQLELAMLNLVFNARDAMPEGGSIVISARLAAADEVTALPGGPYVCLAVTDDGPGMDASIRARAFEPYFTTKPVGAGSGLGLPQAQAFARQSGGDIRLDSAPGRGTKVSLFLPATHASVPAAAQGDVPRRPQRALKVLMVEDDVLVSSVVVPALESEGHRVALCGTADEAMKRLLSGEPFDVLFTDVVMPGRLTGMDLVQWCRRHRPDLPSVAATGYTAQAADGDTQVLRKPYGLDALLNALQSAVPASAPNPSVAR